MLYPLKGLAAAAKGDECSQGGSSWTGLGRTWSIAGVRYPRRSGLCFPVLPTAGAPVPTQGTRAREAPAGFILTHTH